MSWAPAVLLVLVLLSPQALLAQGQSCDRFPSGSLSRQECQRVEDLQRSKQPSNQGGQVLGSQPGTSWVDLRCPGPALRFSEVSAAIDSRGILAGTVTNKLTIPVSEVTLQLELYAANGTPVRAVQAEITPGSLAPGDSGRFELLPPSREGWACYRYDVRGRAAGR